MKYNIKPTAKFQKDLKLVKKRGYDTDKIDGENLILYLTRTGTHSDLFE